jgi:hypothetical protein
MKGDIAMLRRFIVLSVMFPAHVIEDYFQLVSLFV